MTNDETNAHITPENGSRNVFHSNENYELAKASSLQPEDANAQTVQHILLVEDDHTLAILEAETLTTYGYRVITVDSGELAISTLHHTIPDLVVLDLELTGTIGGWDVLQALRRSANVPVLITSSSVTAVRTYMRSCGESKVTLDHLPKPYPLQSLLKRIRRMLPIPPS